MKTKPKICRGTTAETRNLGCGKLSSHRKYGICPTCLYEWSTTTEEGKAWFKKSSITHKEKKEKEVRKEDREKKKEIDVSGAMRLADVYFSRYVRMFYSVDGKCTCYTCGKIAEIKEVDNGHYQKREHKATRYHIHNCRPQCKTCNGDIKHNGKQDVFRVNLSYELGENHVLEIERLARTTIKANAVFYRDIADTYRIKLNELQKLLKVKYW